jgi:hypothetical protein
VTNDYNFCACVFSFGNHAKNAKFSVSNWRKRVGNILGGRLKHRSQIFHKTEKETFHCVMANPVPKLKIKQLHPFATILNECFKHYGFEWSLHLTMNPTRSGENFY